MAAELEKERQVAGDPADVHVDVAREEAQICGPFRPLRSRICPGLGFIAVSSNFGAAMLLGIEILSDAPVLRQRKQQLAELRSEGRPCLGPINL